MGRNIRFENLTGGLNTVQGLGTINSSTRSTESPDMLNVEYFKLSGLRRMDGNTQFGNTQGASITHGHEYRKGNDRLLVTTNSDGEVMLYNNITNEFELIYTFPTKTDRHSIVSYSKGIVISNGVDDLVYYQKDRAEDITGLVSTTTGSDVVTGNSTLFSQEVSEGNYITIGANDYIVASVSSNTSMKLTTPVISTLSLTKATLAELSLCNAKLINSDDPTLVNPIRGLAIGVWKGCLFVGCNLDGILYYSEIGKFNGWDIKYGAGGIPAFYNDDSDIHALGNYSDSMLIHRDQFTYILSGGDAPSDWTIEPYADISCNSQQSFVSSNSQYLVYSQKNGGIYPLLKRTIFTDKFVGNELSVKIRDIFSSLDTANLSRIFFVSYPYKRWAIAYVPFIAKRGSNTAVIYDFQTNSFLLREVPQEITCAFQYKDRVFVGTMEGKVLKEFDGQSFDGLPIKAYWKSPWFDFGFGSEQLSIRDFRIQMSEDSTNIFRLRNYRDGNSTFNERVITNDQPVINALQWSDDDGELTETVWDEFDWVDTQFVTKRFPLPNSYFQTARIELYCDKLGESFEVYGFEFAGLQLEEVPW